MSEPAPARAADAPALAAVHAGAFDDPWSAADIAVLLDSPGVFALMIGPPSSPSGFILCRTAADEAEVLTLAVAPSQRRRGLAGRLLETALAWAIAAGAAAMFLEVAEDNAAALALYGAAGFTVVARRPRYYYRSTGPVAAMVMRRDLNR